MPGCHVPRRVHGHKPHVVYGWEWKKNKMHYVYVLKSQRFNKCYTGRSDNLKRRISEHSSGNVWTTKRMLPVELIYYEAFKSKIDAIRREKYLKTTKGKSSLKQILRESLK